MGRRQRYLWVAVLLVSERTEAKVVVRHGLDVDEVRVAVTCVKGLTARRRDDPPRGLRYYVDVVFSGQPAVVVHYPVEGDPDAFHLGSAYRL